MRNFLSFSFGDFAIVMYMFVATLPAVAALGFTLFMGYWANQE